MSPENRPAVRSIDDPVSRYGRPRKSAAREIAGIIRDGLIGALVLFAILIVASGVAQ